MSEVADRFRRMASELLDTLRKTESSLKRIRQNRVADSSAKGPSDIDKISLQLFLDVQVSCGPSNTSMSFELSASSC